MPKRALPTVSIHVVRAIFAEAMARGAAPHTLCAEFGITPEELVDTDARVPATTMRRLWEQLPARLGVHDFGLSVARRAEDVGGLTVLGYLARSATTVSEALQLFLRYQRLAQDVAVPRWSVAADTERIEYHEVDPAFDMPRHAIEFAIGSALLLMRRATAKPLAPRLVELRHAPPSDDAEARRVFACEIRYGAPAHAITIARTDLALPLVTSDPHLAALLDRHARALVEKLPAHDSVVSDVRRALETILSSGTADLDAVAKRLGLSRRTLQRRLRDERTSHVRVLDELRRELALRAFDAGDAGIQDVVFLLGFSDQSAFHHAFVRWTGVSPGAYLKASRVRRESR